VIDSTIQSIETINPHVEQITENTAKNFMFDGWKVMAIIALIISIFSCIGIGAIQQENKAEKISKESQFELFKDIFIAIKYASLR